MEIIDLVTPEKTKGRGVSESGPNGSRVLPGEKGAELKYIANLKQAYLDLTVDSPNCDRSLVETTLDFSIVPASVNGGERAIGEQSGPTNRPGSAIRIDSNENAIDASVVSGTNRSAGQAKKEPLAPQQQSQQQAAPQSEDGCHETTLQVPTVPWATKEEEEEEEEEEEAGIESDSISESGSNGRHGRSASGSNSSSSSSQSHSNSTSSVEDIPHFILDSTTSPETQNDERFVPRLEVRDATGELMQIDSLMIIDGRYIGDPEDLKLMEKLPPDTQIAAQMLQEEINQDSINTVVEGRSAALTDGDERVMREETSTADMERDESNGRAMEGAVDELQKPQEQEDDDDERAKTPMPPMTESEAVPERASAEPRISPLSDFVTKRNARFKFDAKNENKIDTLRNMPFVLDADRPQPQPQPQKPKYLPLAHHKPADADTDNERTPMAVEPATHGKSSLPSPVAAVLAAALRQGPKGAAADGEADSDSQDDTELTTQNNLTETELSDWAADDAVSENFVDIEFALNPNRTTARRTQKLRQARLPQQQHQRLVVNGNGLGSNRVGVAAPGLTEVSAGPPGATEDGIIRNLALEDIEFMDTGSEEESCVETYSTTNRMMLRNRGYVEIMDPRMESKRALYPPPAQQPPAHCMPLQVVEAINKQIAGRVDYIEQGSYLLGTDDTKTPMNEEPPAKITFSALAAQAAPAQLCSPYSNGVVGDDAGEAHQALGDIEEDSLLMVVSSQEAGSSAGMSTTMTGSTTTTTTEESEALTMVGVLPDSSASSEVSILPRGVTAGGDGGSSSGRGSVTSFSSSVHDGKRAPPALPDCGKPVLPVRKISTESIPPAAAARRTSLDQRKEVRRDSLKRAEDVGYEEYVKRLQHKIQQISNARDSLEVKKSKRKSSKGELGLVVVVPSTEEELCRRGGADEGTMMERTESALPVPVSDSKAATAGGSNGTVGLPNDLGTSDGWVVVVGAPDQPPKSVEKKMEELAKERVKQKDIIHDLVMDKLQTKKQLNAEKRLNRSRNRNNALLVGHASASPGGAGSPIAGGTQSPGVRAEGVTNRALSSGDHFSSPGAMNDVLARTPLVVASKPLHNVYAGSVSMFRSGVEVTQRASAGGQDSVANHFSSSPQVQQQQQQLQLVTPRPQGPSVAEPLANGQPLTTDQLREEARSRARLKSNHDLGLSPEDRLLLLRKKYHIYLHGLTDDDDDDDGTHPNQSDDVKSKEQQHRSKLISSKSVNDVSMLKSQHHHLHHHHHHRNHAPPGTLLSPDNLQTPASSGGPAATDAPPPLNKLTDCVSDPNLCAHSAATANEAGPGGGGGDEAPLRTRNRRKDRERRKSIIEKVSDFFNGRKKTAENGAAGSSSKDASPTKDGLAGPATTAGTSPGTSSSGGVGFLRFKISPKLKDKSKEKEGALHGRCASEDCLNSNASNGSAAVGVPASGSSAFHNSYKPIGRKEAEELEPPPIPPLPLNYQRSDDEFAASNEPNNEFKKIRATSKTSRQAELKRLRIAQEIQREQEQIEVQINDLEARGVEIEKELRGESETLTQSNVANLGANDDGLVKEWLEIMSNITRLKVRDEELSIRQQELQLEHRHAQLTEELNMRLSFGKLDKNSSDVAAEGAILNEMLEIVAKRQALRPSLDAAAAAVTVATTSTPSAANALSHSRVSKDTDI